MLEADIRPDNYTYACVIRACSDNFDFGMLRLVHGSYVSAGLGQDPICCSALVSAYSKLGFVHEACRVFNGIAEPDLVLWNSLISAYVCSSMWDIGYQMFSAMRHSGKKPDGFTLAGLLVGIADSSLLSIGQGLHGLSQKSGLDYDSHVGSLLVSMYSRSGYSQCGEYQKVLLYFRKLIMDRKKPDSVLIATVLASIAQTANVVPGCEPGRMSPYVYV
ncbi:hypothetical protein TSUD_136760 [Trifolium subterraneum]|uniref:Pentatricopeptide repeat-containing protein n=1 Tax=Trifolium subterraneum TaxID=3900 RepID=A0A2Z6PPL0_TRISU|nr:hypothetical protein TSUD_136760 [Trifolium subterraneum]